MSRALPPCLVCGCSLRVRDNRGRRGVRKVIEFVEEPGRPMVGWCGDHSADTDRAAGADLTIESILTSGRVVFEGRRQPSDSNKSPNPAPGGDRSGVENER